MRLILEHDDDYSQHPYHIYSKSRRYTPSDCIFSALNHVEIVRLLLDHDADVHICNHMGDYPIVHAFMMNNWELVKCFLDAGADMYLPDYYTGNYAIPPKLFKKAADYVKKRLKENKRKNAKARQHQHQHKDDDTNTGAGCTDNAVATGTGTGVNDASIVCILGAGCTDRQS
jgi:ankyrin repeat protein